MVVTEESPERELQVDLVVDVDTQVNEFNNVIIKNALQKPQ